MFKKLIEGGVVPMVAKFFKILYPYDYIEDIYSYCIQPLES